MLLSQDFARAPDAATKTDSRPTDAPPGAPPRGVKSGVGRGRRRLGCSALVVLATACAEPLGPEECGALLDRYVTLLVQSDRPSTSEGELLKLKAQAREKAARDPAFRRCASEVSRRQFECALEADTADRFEQCLL